MANYSLPTFGLAIDFETSGYSLPHYAERHQALSFGAIIFNLQTLEPVETIYAEIKHDPRFEWSADAERVHGLTREHLEQNGMTLEEAGVQLFNLIHRYCGSSKIYLLGHRVQFDRAFLEQLARELRIEPEFEPLVIDTSAFGLILLEEPRSEQLFQLCGNVERELHNSLEDILFTLNSLRRMKQWFLAGIASEM
jgi:DNA polymerase III epsilon subunit-like protein